VVRVRRTTKWFARVVIAPHLSTLDALNLHFPRVDKDRSASSSLRKALEHEGRAGPEKTSGTRRSDR